MLFIEYIGHKGTLEEVLLRGMNQNDKNDYYRFQKEVREMRVNKLSNFYDEYEKKPVRYMLN